MAYNCRVLKSKKCEINQWSSSNHTALDIVKEGYQLDTIIAHTKGTVVWIQTGQSNNQGSSGNASYGNCVKIKHPNGYYTLYAHLDSVKVKLNQAVDTAQELGYMGNTGNSYGGHLHFEVRNTTDTKIDPYTYLNADLPNMNPVTPTVNRDETKDQLQVLANDLNVRKGAGTNQTVIGVAKEKGIYNYYEKKDATGYTWYRIADSQWVANVNITVMPKKDELQELKKKVAEQEQTIQELTNKNTLLEEENKKLKEEKVTLKSFTAKIKGYYYIELDKNKTIKYEIV